MDVADNVSRFSVLGIIENVIEDCVSNVALGTAPKFYFRDVSRWSNISFKKNCGLQVMPDAKLTKVGMDTKSSFKKLSRMLKVVCIMYSNVQNDSHCSKRDIFYRDPKLFGSQSTLDKIIDNISVMLRVSRVDLNVHSSGKGLMAGNLFYKEPRGNLVDCSQFPLGVPIPPFLGELTELKSSAKFVLIVEKDASFQRILEDNFIRKCGPCIVLTGKGFPDQNTRSLIKFLWKRFELPTFCLVDADPHGVEIMTVYKYGSKSLCHESKRLAVPDVQWLGVLPSDVDRLRISEKVMLPMTPVDLKKARSLLGRESIYCHQDWIKEINLMINTKLKAEIQCLDSISQKFLVDIYLPNKIKLYMPHKD